MNVKYVQHPISIIFLFLLQSLHSFLSISFSAWNSLSLTSSYKHVGCKFNKANEKSINFQHFMRWNISYRFSDACKLISSIIDRNNFLFWWIKSSSLAQKKGEQEEKYENKREIKKYWNFLLEVTKRLRWCARGV